MRLNSIGYVVVAFICLWGYLLFRFAMPSGDALQSEAAALRHEVKTLQEELSRAHRQIAELTAKNQELTKSNLELKNRPMPGAALTAPVVRTGKENTAAAQVPAPPALNQQQMQQQIQQQQQLQIQQLQQQIQQQQQRVSQQQPNAGNAVAVPQSALSADERSGDATAALNAIVPRTWTPVRRTWSIGFLDYKLDLSLPEYGSTAAEDLSMRQKASHATLQENDFTSVFRAWKPAVGTYPKLAKRPRESTCKHNHKWPRDFNKDPIINVVAGFGSYKYELDRMATCAVGCVYTSNDNSGKTADNWMKVHPGGGSEGPNNKCPHQHATIFTMESEVNMGTLYNPKAGGYDLVASTMLHSDVPAIYVSAAEYGLMAPLQPKPAHGSVFVCAFISNCGASNGRNQYVQDLMKYLKIDSYGSCMNNKDGGRNPALGWFNGKLELLKKYKFTLAFENSNVLDYVSEKLFMPLVAGSVPVVMGAPNSLDFAPSPHSIIETKNFKSAKDLADYLIYLDNNDEEYAKYFTWKTQGVSPRFKALVTRASYHSHCRLCVKVADIYREQYLEPWHYAALVKTYEKPGHVMYQVRPMGEYEYDVVHVPYPPKLEELREAIMQLYRPAKPDLHLYKIEIGFSFKVELTQEQLDTLPQGTEMDAVLI